MSACLKQRSLSIFRRKSGELLEIFLNTKSKIIGLLEKLGRNPFNFQVGLQKILALYL